MSLSCVPTTEGTVHRPQQRLGNQSVPFRPRMVAVRDEVKSIGATNGHLEQVEAYTGDRVILERLWRPNDSTSRLSDTRTSANETLIAAGSVRGGIL